VAGLEYYFYLPYLFHRFEHSFCLFAVDVAKKVDPRVLSTLANPNMLVDDKDGVAAKAEKVYQVDYDTSKEAKIFGINFRSEMNCATDMIAEFGKRGW